MIFILFLAAFLGLWALLNYLLKGWQAGDMKVTEINWSNFSLPKISLPKLPSLAKLQEKIVEEPQTSSSSGIEVQSLVKKYHSGTSEIKAVDISQLEIKKGEFLAIMGRSGSGKSSLLNILGGLDKPSSGVVFLDGSSLGQLSSNELGKLRNSKIGFIFQESNLIPTLTALENVELPLKYSKVSGASKKDRALQALEAVGLRDRVDHFPSQLSGGENQRVAIARALVNNPSLVLADEPTGEVDSQTSSEIISLMKDLNRKLGTTFVIVTHDPLVAQATNRILRLQDGKIISDKKVIKIDGSLKAEVELV